MVNSKLFFSVMASAFILSSWTAAAQVVSPDAVVVCRSKQCKAAHSMMTREFLYNKLGSMLANNINRRVLLCDADPSVKVCLNDGIEFNVQAGVAGSLVTIPSARVIDTKPSDQPSTLTFILDYKINVNDTYPECQASLNELVVSSPDKITVEAPGFECRFTANGVTAVNATYSIDYIDFDYGILGAYYTFGVGQTSRGGGTGYALLRFSEPANPNNELLEGCDCACDDALVPPCQCEEPKTIIHEKTVTEYEVAPIEVIVKTKAPVDGTKTQDIKINGVTVPNVPVVVDTESIPSREIIEETVTEVAPGEVSVSSNKEILE